MTARILLCDDDILAKSWMASALRDGGFEVTEASSVDDCLKSAAAGTYDLAVLDVMMPGGELDWIETKGGFATGVAVARRLKQQCPDMKIVGISQAPVFETLQWFRANADGFIVKAELLSDPGAIVERIRKVIDPAGWLKRCRSFIVHGHDRRALRALQDHLRAFGFPPPTVLGDIAFGGRTIIEKLDDCANVDYVFVLMTPDEMVSHPKPMSGSLVRWKRSWIPHEPARLLDC